MEQADTIIQIPHFYGSLKGMQNKFDKYARQDAFTGATREEWEAWKETSRETLKELLGWKYMETCDLDPRVEEVVELENGIRREKVILQVEPEVYMPMYILIPPKQNEGKQKCFLALPGHQGAGKFSVAGRNDIPAVKRMIEFYHYDYGMQLAKRGYVAICPDCRGFGERRDEALQKGTDEKSFLTSTCFHLAHMAEAVGAGRFPGAGRADGTRRAEPRGVVRRTFPRRASDRRGRGQTRRRALRICRRVGVQGRERSAGAHEGAAELRVRTPRTA